MTNAENPHQAVVVALIKSDGDLITDSSEGWENIFRVVLNVGATDGVMAGHRFLIFALGPELFDPRTKESLGSFESVRGIGRVVYVQERMCTIVSERKRLVRKPKNALLAPFGQDYVDVEEDAPFNSVQPGDLARQV